MDWHGCYNGSYDWLVPNAYSHPAKMAPGLCLRILKRLEKLGFLKNGEAILDFMAGIGTTAIGACLKGHKAITVELESKFVDLCQSYWCLGIPKVSVIESVLPPEKEGWKVYIHGHGKLHSFKSKTEAENWVQKHSKEHSVNVPVVFYSKALPERKRWKISSQCRCGKANWHKCHWVLGNKEYVEGKLGKPLDWTIIQGDSRKLSRLLGERGLCGMISPPYYGQTAFQDKEFMIRSAEERSKRKAEGKTGGHYASPEAFKKQAERLEEKYSDDPRNIGNLSDRPLIGITSPPHGEAIQKVGGECKLKHIGISQRKARQYSDNPHNIGNLPDRSYVGITSPPYSNAGWKADEDPANPIKREIERQKLFPQRPKQIPGRYSSDPQNIGNLPDKSTVGIISPPYSQAQTGGGIAKEGYKGAHVDKQGKNQPAKFGERCAYMADFQGQSKGQISNLPDRPLVAITSPPYAIEKTSGGLNTKPPRSKQDQSGRDSDSPSQKGAKEGYGEAQGQIGKLPDRPLVGVVSPPYGHSAKGEDISVEKSCKVRKTQGGQMGQSLRQIDGYGESKEQIGNLPDRSLVGVVSPPYEEALESGSRHTKDGIPGRDPQLGALGKYGVASKGQLGEEKGESYLSAMLKVYQEAAKICNVLVTVTKNPTRDGKLRRLDLDTKRLLEIVGFKVIEHHRAILFEEVETPTLFGETEKKVKGRLSFFKRLSYNKGQPVARWEDVFIAVRR